MNRSNVFDPLNCLRKTTSDRNTALGAIISSLFCPICFPALAGIASALGLSFLVKYEGWFLVLFHLFTLISAFSVWRGFNQHRVKLPFILSGIGVLLIFGTLYQLFPIYAFVYVGMVFLVGGAFVNSYYVKKYRCACEVSNEPITS